MISRRGYTCDLAAGQGTSSNKIRTYPAGSVEPWNTRTGAKVGEGRRKRRREEKKEKERNTQIKQPFLFVSPFWSEKTPISGRCVIDEIEEVLFAIFFGFWSSILIRRLETEKSLLKCFGIIKQSGRIAFV